MVRALKKAGFRVISPGKHIGMSDGTHRVTVPRHNRLNPYTVRSILSSAQISDANFKELL